MVAAALLLPTGVAVRLLGTGTGRLTRLDAPSGTYERFGHESRIGHRLATGVARLDGCRTPLSSLDRVSSYGLAFSLVLTTVGSGISWLDCRTSIGVEG